MFAYIDESGDTGRTAKSSKYFILTCLIFNDDKIIKHKIKKLRNKIIKSDKKHAHYFHSFKEDDKTRDSLIKIINDYSVGLFYIALKKKNSGVYNETLDKMLDILEQEHNIEKVFVASYDKRKNTILKYKNDNRF